MFTIREGYAKDAPVIATVADKAAADRWARDNGYGFLSIRREANGVRVARIFDPMKDLEV